MDLLGASTMWTEVVEHHDIRLRIPSPETLPIISIGPAL